MCQSGVLIRFCYLYLAYAKWLTNIQKQVSHWSWLKYHKQDRRGHWGYTKTLSASEQAQSEMITWKKEEENNLFSLPMHCKPIRTFLGDMFSTTGFWDYLTPLTHPVHFYSDYFIYRIWKNVINTRWQMLSIWALRVCMEWCWTMTIMYPLNRFHFCLPLRAPWNQIWSILT